MHWSRVKTILIFLFLALDMVMFGYVIFRGHDPYSVSKSEIRDIISIYEANNLEISEKIIPQKSERLGITELNNLWTDKSKIAGLFLQEGFGTENENKFVKDSRTLEFHGNKFIYKNAAVGEDEGESLNDFLRGMHIFTEEDCVSGETVRQKINDKPVFETELTVIGGKDGISQLEGYWIVSEDFGSLQKQPVRLKSVSGVLFDFLSTNAYDKTGDRIISIELGYSTGSAENDTVHKLISVLPAYKITAESGGYAVFDAAGGNLLYEFSAVKG